MYVVCRLEIAGGLGLPTAGWANQLRLSGWARCGLRKCAVRQHGLELRQHSPVQLAVCRAFHACGLLMFIVPCSCGLCGTLLRATSCGSATHRAGNGSAAPDKSLRTVADHAAPLPPRPPRGGVGHPHPGPTNSAIAVDVCCLRRSMNDRGYISGAMGGFGPSSDVRNNAHCSVESRPSQTALTRGGAVGEPCEPCDHAVCVNSSAHLPYTASVCMCRACVHVDASTPVHPGTG